MQVYNDGLDDPFVGEVSTAFTGGVFSATINPSNLPPNQLNEAKNIDISLIGDAITRRGTAFVSSTSNTDEIQGLFFYKNASTEQLIKVQSNILGYSTGSTWTDVGSITTSSSSQVEMAQMADLAYVVNGTIEMQTFNGTAIASITSYGGSAFAPNGFKYIVNHQNRIFGTTGAGSNGDWLYPSGILAGSVYQVTDIIKVGGTEGDPIKGFSPWIDSNLFVGKTRSLWVVDTSNGVGTSAVVRKMHNTIGLASHRSIAQVTDPSSGTNDIFFLARTGVHSLQRTLDVSAQGITASLSLPIDDIIKRINWSVADKSCAVYWDNKYMLALPLDNATAPNYVIIYNTFNRSWSGYWTGWLPRIFGISAFDGDLRLCFGQNDGKVYQWLSYILEENEVDGTYTDGGTAISSFVKTKGFVHANPMNLKYGDQAEFEFFSSRATVDLEAIVDDSSPTTLASGVSTVGSANPVLPFVLPVTLGNNGVVRTQQNITPLNQFRQVQYQVEAASKKMAFRSVYANAVVTSISRSV